ncbi:hypothetical protein AA11825_1893 [Acetobacter pomorum DSM 11825]|nr:hypothetical protein AA11825_1893 [Acetobacter pomorum DSM 11825]
MSLLNAQAVFCLKPPLPKPRQQNRKKTCAKPKPRVRDGLPSLRHPNLKNVMKHYRIQVLGLLVLCKQKMGIPLPRKLKPFMANLQIDLPAINSGWSYIISA